MVTSETKKRFLLSKWRVQAEIQSERDGLAWQVEQLEATLTDVKYWLLSGLVHHRLVSDPRAILRKIEDVL